MPEEVNKPTEAPKEEQDKPQKPEDSQQEDPKLDEEVKDRTKEQFDKLKKSNQELKQEKDEIVEKYESVLDSITPKRVPQQTQQRYQAPVNIAPKENQFENIKQEDIDKVFDSMKDDEGYLDGNKLLDTLKKMDARSRKAEQRAQRAEEHAKRVQIAAEEKSVSEETKRVHEKYPQLDPDSDQFDRTFWKAVRGEMLDQAFKGKKDFMAAADEWYPKLFKEEEVTKEEKETKEKKDEQKEQINVTRPRSSSMAGYYKDEKEDALREKIRKGKKGAVAEMLKRKGL